MTQPDRTRSHRGGWWVLLAALLAWGATAALSPQHIKPALDQVTALLSQILPVLGLVFILLFLANLMLERPWIERHFGQDAGVRGWLISLGAGVLAAGPPWPWYALAGQLLGRGMRPGLAATFLYARAIKLPLIPLMIHYFGLAYTLTLSAWLMLLALASGMAMERLLSGQSDECPKP